MLSEHPWGVQHPFLSFAHECMYVFVCLLSHVQPSEATWTVTCQAPLSMGFARQEYWNGLPFHPPWGLLPNLGMEPASFARFGLAGRCFTTDTTHLLLN